MTSFTPRRATTPHRGRRPGPGAHGGSGGGQGLAHGELRLEKNGPNWKETWDLNGINGNDGEI